MNYQKELDKLIERLSITKSRPKLLIHSCCAPCSSYVLEYLANYFEITVFYYNPNIFPEEEYSKRVAELKQLLDKMPLPKGIHLIEGSFYPEEYYRLVKGMEEEPEGGNRCFACYELRLKETARLAAENQFDYFTTTLSISPYKNAEKLNEIGERLAGEYKVAFLPSDFKKRNGYKRSIELSGEYNLYRQDYCGCVYSKRERDLRKDNPATSQ